ncbi:MAG: 30S ribosomal protein S12 methylthiotransferase RimO, partial [Clostridiales bacterium]|nr:30S ribosomal protein S12 methylthiotransferase RimO [Clostridiales bacterium]
ENTPAYNLPLKIDEEIKEQRYNALMSVQHEISNRMMTNFIDKTLPVIIDEIIEGEPIYMGRTQYDTPEVDGVVYVHTDKTLIVGNIYNVYINDSLEYDLIGEI